MNVFISFLFGIIAMLFGVQKYSGSVSNNSRAATRSSPIPNSSSVPNSSQVANTKVAPVITEFAVPTSSASFDFPITTFAATTSGPPITGYMVNESSTPPSLTASRWSATPPTTYVALSEGSKVLYAWVKDAAGNVSKSLNRSIVVAIANTPLADISVLKNASLPTNASVSKNNPLPANNPTPPSYAKTYYLSTSGSDGATGDSGNPWRTLAYACSRATGPASVIHVRAGTYNESSKCNLAVGVSIEGEGTSSTTIRSTYAASSSSDAAIYLASGTHTDGNQSISALTLDGSNFTAQRGILVNFRNNVSVHHTKIINFNASALFFRGSTGAWDVLPPVFASGNSVHDNVITSCATRSASESASMRINGQLDMSVYNNTFDQTSRRPGENGNILGGEWNKALKIYNNTFTKNSDEGSQWNFFTELWHWEGGGEIHDNTFNGAATMDIVDVTPSTYGYGLKIYNNKYLSSVPVKWATYGVQAINIELRVYAVGVYIYGNYFKNVPNGVEYDVTVNSGEGYTFNRVSDIKIYQNLFENIGSLNGGGHAIWMNTYGGNKNITWDNVNIYSNTMTGGTTTNWGNGILWSSGGTATNVSIRDNIIQGFKEGPAKGPISFIFGDGFSGATMSNVTVTNNLYWGNASTSTSYGNVSINNRVDQNNVNKDPLFMSGGFSPIIGSPACRSSTSGSYVGAYPCK